MPDFQSARFWAREIIESAVSEGSVAVDATMGNGNDTQWLCERVGNTGRVYAFDIQAEAVARTEERLRAAGLLSRATLLCESRERILEAVAEPIDAAVFNLGWLPGAEHGVTTQTETTLRAAEAALACLREGGVMTICIYPGHEEGERERKALLSWAEGLDPRRYDAIVKAYLNQPNHPPCMLAVRKLRRKGGQSKQEHI